MKPKLIFFGSSHAKRLVLCAQRLNEKYEIVDFSKPGARIGDLIVPNFELFTELDTVFVQVFGNSTFYKNIRITKEGNNRVIHLLKFNPRPIKELEAEYDYLLELVKKAKCKIVVIDNILRHISCCTQHYDKRIFSLSKMAKQKNERLFYQRKENHFH